MHTPPKRPLFPLQAGAPRPSVAPGPWDARTPSGARRGTGGRTGPCRGVASEMFSSCQFDKFDKLDKLCCEMHQICEVLTKFNQNVIRCLPMFAKKRPYTDTSSTAQRDCRHGREGAPRRASGREEGRSDERQDREAGALHDVGVHGRTGGGGRG